MNNCCDCGVRLRDSRSVRCRSCAKTGSLNPLYGTKVIRDNEFRRKARLRQTGELNSNWKGDKVGYLGLHAWVNNNKPKPSKCEMCNEEKPLDLANISQEYKRDINDWEYLCRKCHMTKDGRIERLKSNLWD